MVQADRIDAIGLDWLMRNIDGVRSFGHGGVTVGYVSDLLVVPGRDLAFVGLTNATNGVAVNQRLRRWALARYAEIQETDLVPDPTLNIDVNRYVGSYQHPFSELTVTAGESPGTIIVTPSKRDVEGWQPPLDPAMTCGFFAEDHIVTLDAPGRARIGAFGRDDPDRADWLLWGERRTVPARL